MPHQCIRCGKEHPDGSDALLKGCSCGAKFFLFCREKIPDNFTKLDKEERKEVFENVQEMVRKEEKSGNEDGEEKTVILELENISALRPGKFELDLLSLFRKKPVIYKYGDGKYVIDLESTFKMLAKK